MNLKWLGMVAIVMSTPGCNFFTSLSGTPIVLAGLGQGNGSTAGSNSQALNLSTAHSSIALNNTLSYTISGGVPPYTISANQGDLTSATGSGIFTPASLGSAQLNVQDSGGAQASAVVTVVSAMSLGTSNVSPTLARAYQSSVTIQNKIYTYGGSGSAENLSDLWVYDPNAGTQGMWTQLSPSGSAPPARSGHCATVISNKMYIFGGVGNSYLNDLWVYDPSVGTQGSWSQLSPSGTTPAAREWASAVTIANKMYVFGGGANGSGDNDLWVYDPSVGAQGSWTLLSPTGSTPVARYAHTAVNILNKMYVFAGTSGSNDLWVYDPSVGSDGSWTQLGPAGTLPHARSWHVATANSNLMSIFGGTYYSGESVYLNDLWSFDPSAGAQGTWSQVSPSGTTPSGRLGSSMAVVSGKEFVFGGEIGGGTIYSDLFTYDPTSGAQGAWTEPASLFTSSILMTSSTIPYVLSGGVLPISIAATSGSVDNSSGSGNFTGLGSASTSNVIATDAIGNTATLALQVWAPVSITAASSSIANGASMAYTVTGGSGIYQVQSELGEVSNSSGSGTYTATSMWFQSLSGQTDTLQVTDSILNTSSSFSISVY